MNIRDDGFEGRTPKKGAIKSNIREEVIKREIDNHEEN